MTTDERNTALAALIGAEGYEATGKCPEGHRYSTMTHKGVRTNICWDCLVHSEVNAKELEAHYDDPAWRPEWRVQAVPKDFAVPGVLEPLARELVKRWGEEEMVPWGWMMDYETKPDGRDYNVDIWIEDCDCIVGEGEGRTYEIALGEALLAAARKR